MPERPQPTHSGDLVTDAAELTLDELCKICGVPKDKVMTYVAEGIVEPKGSERIQWRFSQTTVVELHRVKRLERDLGLNTAGVALALDLMSQIATLQRKVARLERQNEQEDPNG